MTDDVLKLSNQLCFPLYAVSREITQCYSKFLVELDITYPQYLVLMVLWEENNMSVKSIGERLFLDSGTLTPLLKRMETKKIITRKRSQQDERTVNISLTEKGRQIKEKAKEIHAAIKSETTLTEEEIETLKKIIYKILNNREK